MSREQPPGQAPPGGARSEPPASGVSRQAPPGGARSEPQASGVPKAGPPPLAPFGLVLHHDGRWSHEGHPILNRKLREHFDRSVRYLPDEGKYVVTLRHFRGEIQVEEAAFFVREVDLEAGRVVLSDGSREPLELSSLRLSERDGALLCTVKREVEASGLPARFTHAAHAELMQAVEGDERLLLRIGGRAVELPAALQG